MHLFVKQPCKTPHPRIPKPLLTHHLHPLPHWRVDILGNHALYLTHCICIQVRDNEAKQLPIRHNNNNNNNNASDAADGVASPESVNTEQDVGRRRSIKRDSTEMEMGGASLLPDTPNKKRARS